MSHSHTGLPPDGHLLEQTSDTCEPISALNVLFKEIPTVGAQTSELFLTVLPSL
jgi:hypothetical protein